MRYDLESREGLELLRERCYEFRKEIRKTSYEGLVKKLRDKLAQQEEER